jgi:hypothetical protein
MAARTTYRYHLIDTDTGETERTASSLAYMLDQLYYWARPRRVKRGQPRVARSLHVVDSTTGETVGAMTAAEAHVEAARREAYVQSLPSARIPGLNAPLGS